MTRAEMSPLRRWVGEPLLELAYVSLSLFVGIVTFTVAVTGLALGVGLLPLFLLGLPVLLGTVYVVHGLAWFERTRAAVFLGVELAPRPMAGGAGQHWLRRAWSRIASAEFWKETSYALLLLPLGALSGAVVLSFWAAALAGLLLPV